jgi:hypothetical protein
LHVLGDLALRNLAFQMLQDSEVWLEPGVDLAQAGHEEVDAHLGEESGLLGHVGQRNVCVSGEHAGLAAVRVDQNDPATGDQVGVDHALVVAAHLRLDFELGSEGVGEGEGALSLDLLSLLGETQTVDGQSVAVGFEAVLGARARLRLAAEAGDFEPAAAQEGSRQPSDGRLGSHEIAVVCASLQALRRRGDDGQQRDDQR